MKREVIVPDNLDLANSLVQLLTIEEHKPGLVARAERREAERAERRVRRAKREASKLHRFEKSCGPLDLDAPDGADEWSR